MPLRYLAAWVGGVAGPAIAAVGAPSTGAIVALGFVVGGGVWLLVSDSLRKGALAWVARVVAGVVLVAAVPSDLRWGAIVAVLGILTGQEAWLARLPTIGADRRRDAVVTTALPLIGGAQVAWAGEQGALTVVLLAGAIAIVGAARRDPKRFAFLDRGVRVLFRSLGNVTALVVLLPFASILLYLPGLIGSLGRRLVPESDRGSTFHVREISTVTERRLASRPFAPTPAGARRRRNLGGGLLVVAVTLVLLLVPERRPLDPAPHTGRPSESVEPNPLDRPEVAFGDLPAYAGSDFADALQVEQRRFATQLPRDSVTGMGSGDFVGQYTNVSDGVRRTSPSTCDGCPGPVSLWLVGGSTAFGLGQRDEFTIASDLVSIAAADGIDLVVTNLAVPGWTIWQEYQAVSRRLDDSATEAPDLVVSFGGYNDAAAALVSVVDGSAGVEPVVLDFDDVGAFVASGLTADDGGGAAALAARGVEAYRSSAERLRSVASDRGAESVFFFQPDALASPAQFEALRGSVRGLGPRSASDLDQILEEMSSALADETVDLRHLYDDVEESLFVDAAHTNETGATLAAAAMYDRLRPAIRPSAG